MNRSSIALAVGVLTLLAMGFAFVWITRERGPVAGGEGESTGEPPADRTRHAIPTQPRESEFTAFPSPLDDAGVDGELDARSSPRPSPVRPGEVPSEIAPRSGGAMGAPVMTSLSLDDPQYSPVLDARQHFYALEKELLAASPLTPERWEQLMVENTHVSGAVVRRAAELRASGHMEPADQLLAEWGRLRSAYRPETFGGSADSSPPPPVD